MSAVRDGGQLVCQRLRHVADEGETAAHVAVDGAIAHCQLALVACRQHQSVELVRESHEDIPAKASLQVFLGDVRCSSREGWSQLPFGRLECRPDRDRLELYPECIRCMSRVSKAPCGRVRTGHGNTSDVPGTQRVRSDSHRERRVDTAAQTHDRLAEAALPDVVASPDDQGVVDGFDLINLRTCPVRAMHFAFAVRLPAD